MIAIAMRSRSKPAGASYK